MWVTSIAMAAEPFAARAEPALKPNQPTHSIPVPTNVRARLWGATFHVPKSLRLPRNQAQTRPATPALTCTTVPPA